MKYVEVQGEKCMVLDNGPDGWIRVMYPDGDVVWTPPNAIKEITR